MAQRFRFRRKNRPVHRYGAHQIAVPSVEESTRDLSTRMEQWQSRVLKYAGIVPEVMTGYLFVHHTMDMVTFDIQRFDRTTNDWVDDDSPEMKGIERRINTAFQAGRAAALGHLVEEAFVLVERTADNGFKFETLAPTEIRTKNKTQVEKRVLKDGDSKDWVVVAADVTIIRIYTPDPSDRLEAGGPHKPLLDLLETMALEMMRDQADAVSVLAGNGFLYIPSEIIPEMVDSVDASETPGTRKHFEATLEDAMVATITDRKRGEAVVPFVLYGPAEFSKDIRHILPTRGETAAEATERMEGYVRRYARDIDLPEEVITGAGDMNHWSGWKVDENTWAYHLLPRGKQIADALYAGLVRAIISNLPGDRDPDDYRLHPNGAAAIAKTDKTGAAETAYQWGAITLDAYLEAIGFQPSDGEVDADELRLLSIAGSNGVPDDEAGAAPPSRAAAASLGPDAILRQASKIANQHQTKLEELFRRTLAKVADDAALAGRKAGREKAKQAREFGKAAAGRVTFEGYEPGVYFAKYADALTAATTNELLAFIKRVATLCGLEYSEVRRTWQAEFAARAESVTSHANEAAEHLARRSFEGGKPVRVNDNIMRSLSSIANGGTNAVTGRAANTDKPTHAAADPAIVDALKSTVGGFATRYTWVVGHPDRPFPPHQALDGRSWFTWQEFDALELPDAHQWLQGNVMHPGDHDGCQCGYDCEFVPIEAAA